MGEPKLRANDFHDVGPVAARFQSIWQESLHQMLLDAQRILLIGIPPATIPGRTSKFFDAFDLNDFKLVAWNAETFIAETQENTGQSFGSYVDSFIYQRFKESYDRKILQISNWIKDGHVLVIFPFIFSPGPQTDGASGVVVNVDINQFLPFSLVSLAQTMDKSLNVVEEFSTQFRDFVDVLRGNWVLSGEEIVPLFRAGSGLQKYSKIAGAAFRVGKGAIVFSPPAKVWDHPKLAEYFDALVKLPGLLSFHRMPEKKEGLSGLVQYFDATVELPHLPDQPGGLLPQEKGAFQRTVLGLTAWPALLLAAVALSPFWAPSVAPLLPWGEGRFSVAGQNYASLAARPVQSEKHPASSGLDLDAIKSAESTLAGRVDRLEAALFHRQDLPDGLPSNASAALAPSAPGPRVATEQPPAPASPAVSPHLSTDEIAGILARGDSFLLRGDVASARLFYERGADAGDGRSALRLGATFDPAFLDMGVLRGVPGNPLEARLWYQRARDLGEAEAERRMNSLEKKWGSELR